MPYIAKSERKSLDPHIEKLIEALRVDDANDGKINYVISRIVAGAVRTQGGYRYRNIARGVAAFECAKLEFYRRLGTARENQAIASSGDIHEYLGH